MTSNPSPHRSASFVENWRRLPAGVKVLVGLGLATLLACSSGGTGSSSRQSTPADGNSTTAAAPAGPGMSKDNPAPIGTEISPAKDWTIKVLSTELNADARLAKANMFNKPEDGKQYLAVKLTVHNGSDKPGSFATNANVGILTPNGEKLTDTFATMPGRLDRFAQLQPGGTSTGEMVFEVPKDAVNDVVLLAEPLFTADVNEDQRFLAVK